MFSFEENVLTVCQDRVGSYNNCLRAGAAFHYLLVALGITSIPV